MAERKKFIKVELEYPIEKQDADGNSIVISSVNVYRLKVKHLKMIPDSLFEKLAKEGDKASISPKELIPIIVACSSISDTDIDELDGDDLKKIAEEMSQANFL